LSLGLSRSFLVSLSTLLFPLVSLSISLSIPLSVSGWLNFSNDDDEDDRYLSI